MPKSRTLMGSQARTILQIFALQIRNTRVRKKITQKRAAEDCGISVGTLRRIESGHPDTPIGRYLELAAFLGLHIFEEDTPRLLRDEPEIWHESKRKQIAILIPRPLPKNSKDDF